MIDSRKLITSKQYILANAVDLFIQWRHLANRFAIHATQSWTWVYSCGPDPDVHN